MARLKWHVVPGDKARHVFNGGFPKRQTTKAFKVRYVDTFVAVPIDPSAGKYVMVDGKLRRAQHTPLAKAA